MNNVKLDEYEYSFYRGRWNIQDVEEDIQYFCDKYAITNTHTGFKDIRSFVRRKQMKK